MKTEFECTRQRGMCVFFFLTAELKRVLITPGATQLTLMLL